jgi:hypothetical protein
MLKAAGLFDADFAGYRCAQPSLRELRFGERARGGWLPLPRRSSFGGEGLG